jgi:hypothetical protein
MFDFKHGFLKIYAVLELKSNHVCKLGLAVITTTSSSLLPPLFYFFLKVNFICNLTCKMLKTRKLGITFWNHKRCFYHHHMLIKLVYVLIMFMKL